MIYLIIALIVVGAYIVITFLVSLFIYFLIFFNNLKALRLKETGDNEKDLVGPQYENYTSEISSNFKYCSSLKYDEVYVTSYDHKKLFGKLYIKDLNKPFIIMFHGYKGGGIRDFSGIIPFLLDNNYNLLVVDERSHGHSEGKTITFGIKERLDVIKWADYIYSNYQNNDIYLYGISMGGATVLMSSNLNLPKNVKGIIADCPFTCPKDIIIDFSKKYHLPMIVLKHFVYFSALLFGHFRVKDASAITSVKNTNIPIILFHGTEDKFVPPYMSERIYNANPDNIKLVKINGAPHVISCIVDKEKYHKELLDFLNK